MAMAMLRWGGVPSAHVVMSETTAGLLQDSHKTHNIQHHFLPDHEANEDISPREVRYEERTFVSCQNH